MSTSRVVLPMLIAIFFLPACGLFRNNTAVPRAGTWLDWDGEGGWSGYEAGSGEAGDMIMAMSAPSEPLPTAALLEEGGSRSMEKQQSPSLRAGSVDDNAKWDDYLLYRLQFHERGIPVHDIDVTERHIVQVLDRGGRPVLGALIEISSDAGDLIARLRSHADGRAYFFPAAMGDSTSREFHVRVQMDGRETAASVPRDEREHSIVLNLSAPNRPIRLDVHFLIDSTGSMSDEIQRLKENMISVAERVQRLSARPEVRFGMTIYRDRGDLFISRTHDFTPDTNGFTVELAQVQAEGGGDYPESLNEGLHNAILLPEWRVDETVSLIFLIADAPPHLDYGQDYDYAEDVLQAAEHGIKIYPLASSGLDDQGEYIFRQLAQITGGKFLFLTYGADGAPGDETTHHVDDYSVLALDDLVVKVIEEELAFQGGGQ